MVVKAVLAAGAFFVIMKVGLAMLRGFSQPGEPAQPGELRKVNLRYCCSICGAVVRMVQATEDLPAAPRHCQEEMDLVAPLYD